MLITVKDLPTHEIPLCLYSKRDTNFWSPTFYTDAKKSGKSDCKLGKISKVAQSLYDSVQKSELYAIIMPLS